MWVLLLTFVLSSGVFASAVSSPDGIIVVGFSLNNAGKPLYNVSFKGLTMVEKSALRLETSDEIYTSNLRLAAETQKRISDKYRLYSGKQTKLKAVCNRKESTT